MSVIRPQMKGFVQFAQPNKGSAKSAAPPHPPKLTKPKPAPPPTSTKAASKESAPAEVRFVNAWIEDGEPPLQQGRTYSLAINIGHLRERALATEPLAEIDWGNKDWLSILCVLSGNGVSIAPRQQVLQLPKSGEAAPIFFRITPTRAGGLFSRIGLYLAHELTLLEEFEVRVAVQTALVA